MEIKLSDLLLLLKKKLWLLGAVIFICGAAALLISVFIIPPRYEAKTTILVEPRRLADTSVANLNLTTNLVTAQVVGDDFLREVRQSLMENGKGDIEEAQLRKLIRTERRDQNYTFSVIVNSKSPDKSYDIAKTMETLILSSESSLIQSAEYVFKAHTPPERDSSPTSPNVVLNTVLGVFIGAVLGVLLILLLDRLDITVKSEESIVERHQGVAILGVIYEHKGQVVRGSGYDKEAV